MLRYTALVLFSFICLAGCDVTPDKDKFLMQGTVKFVESCSMDKCRVLVASKETSCLWFTKEKPIVGDAIYLHCFWRGAEKMCHKYAKNRILPNWEKSKVEK